MAGVFARFDGLGSRPVSNDEYYFARSVERILETGSVRFPTGGYYTRGLLPQYLTAASWRLFGRDGFGFRLPVALFSLASLAAAFLYARTWVKPVLAGAVVGALLLSSWQVEMGRFLRMYAPFQLATLLFLVAVHRAYVAGRWRLRYLPHLLLVLAALCHELAVFLCPLLFLPLAAPTGRRALASRHSTLAFASAGLATSLAVVLWSRGLFYHLGVGEQFPAGYVPQDPSTIRLPADPIWSLGSGQLVDLAFLSVLMAAVILGFAASGALARVEGRRNCLLSLLLISSLTHQFGIAALLLLVLAARHGFGWLRSPSRGSRALWVGSMMGTVVWSALAVLSKSRLEILPAGKSLRQLFFGLPDLSATVWLWWRYLPMLGSALAVALVIVLIRRRHASRLELLAHPATLILFVTLSFGVFHPRIPSLRYYFFLYPVMLTVLALATSDLAEWWTRRRRSDRPLSSTLAAAVVAMVFLFSEDFRTDHLVDVSGPAATFCIGEFKRLRSPQGPWFCRDDVASPSGWLNDRVDEATFDPIIVASQPTASFYLERPHAHYLRRTSTLFDAHSRAAGTVDLWSGRPLVSTPAQAQAYLEGAEAGWLLRAIGERRAFPEQFLFPGRRVRSEQLYISEDGRIEVLRLRFE